MFSQSWHDKRGVTSILKRRYFSRWANNMLKPINCVDLHSLLLNWLATSFAGNHAAGVLVIFVPEGMTTLVEILNEMMNSLLFFSKLLVTIMHMPH